MFGIIQILHSPDQARGSKGKGLSPQVFGMVFYIGPYLPS